MAWDGTPAALLSGGVSALVSATTPTSNLDATNWDDVQSVDISLNPGESCQIQIWGVNPASVVSDLQFRVLTSPDGGTSWDNTPYLTGSVPQATATTWSSAHSRTIVVYGVKTFKLQFSSTVSSSRWTVNGTDAAAGQKSTYVKDGISA